MQTSLNEELAVTKNDIKHLESDMSEIKTGIKEINDNFSKHMEQMGDKYVKKEDFNKHVDSSDKRIENIKALNYLVLGCLATGLILLVVNLIMGQWK